MPVGSDMRRYGSNPSLNKNSELRLSSNLDSSSYDGYHQSTPDLSNVHTRTSSVDSYEDSHGNHSRQSSDSVDIPTRTTKTQRKVSQSEDPLKFIKLKPSKDLAKQAEEQIHLVKEVKHVRKVIEKEEEDWQSNLSSWKNRRRRVSAAAIERVEGTDDLVKEDEEKKRHKTYDQIRREREKRKSTGQLQFYPIEDEENLLWDVRAPTEQEVPTEVMSRTTGSTTESKRAPMLSSKLRSKSMGHVRGVASWAEDEAEESNTKSHQTKDTNKRTLDENHNSNNSSNLGSSGRRLSNKFSNIMKSFESFEDETTSKQTVERPPKKVSEFKVESKSERFKDSKVLDTQTARSSLQPKKKAEPTKLRNYIEKTIKIKQKPHNAKGFGITVVGGQDKKQPVTIDKVNIGSAADVCEVQAKDEILSINNRDIGIMTQAMVRKVIEDANKKGELELRVKRYNTVASDEEEEGDDDAFQPSPTSNPLLEPETIFSRSSFEPSRTSSRITESPPTPEKSQRSRPSYQPSPLYRREESPKTESNIKASFDVSISKKSESATTNESTGSFSRSSYEFSARSRTTEEKKVESSPPKEEVVTATPQQFTYSSPKVESSRSSESPKAPRRRQHNYNYSNTDDYSGQTNILSELEKEKQWAMEQMSKMTEPSKEEKKETTEPIEEPIVPQKKPPVESSYPRSYMTPTAHSHQNKEEPALPQTMPSYERVEEEKPTIRVNRSRPYQEVTEPTPTVRQTPVTMTTTKPEVNHLDLSSNHQRDRSDELSPSQSSGGFGPPEILRRWQRPRPRSEYSSTSSVNEDKRQSAASLDSTASSPRFPEDDISQNLLNGEKPHAVVGQPVTLEIRPEHAAQSFTVPSTAAPTLLIDPRNRMEDQDTSLPQYNLHFNIGDKAREKEPHYDIEAERERIRQEEKDRLEHERRRREMEEERRIQEKEARLREEEVKIEREKQKIAEMKASMEREKMELSKKQSETRKSDHYNSYGDNDLHVKDKFTRSRPDSSHQFSAYADSNSLPRSLDMSSWRSSQKQEETHQRDNDAFMNRTARPFSRNMDNNQTNYHGDKDTFSKEDVNNLNNAPKPKVRSSHDWMQNNGSGSKHSSRSESPNEHWLVEEAERRRISGHSSSHQTGPIKPKTDIITNRWQEDRYGSHPPRSLSPQNTRSSDFKQFSARPQNNLNQTLPANFSMGHIKSKAQPPVPPKPNRTSTSSSNRSSSNLSSPVSPSSPKNHAEQVVAVSGKQLCSHCSQELGFGAAMVIESLGLYYHVQCFKCCVCHMTLGNGSQGADVRVRVNKLHCRNCYSNDEAGLKFSKV